MNIYKDQCYICLDEKTYFKKSEVCVNDGCWMFICKQCFVELTKSDFTNCPICHEGLVKESYYLDHLSFMKKAKETMIKVLLYLLFYSIGLSTITFFLFTQFTKKALYDRAKETNSSDWLISLFVFPLLGFVTWYCIVVLILIVYNLIKKKDSPLIEEDVVTELENESFVEVENPGSIDNV